MHGFFGKVFADQNRQNRMVALYAGIERLSDPCENDAEIVAPVIEAQQISDRAVLFFQSQNKTVFERTFIVVVVGDTFAKILFKGGIEARGVEFGVFAGQEFTQTFGKCICGEEGPAYGRQFIIPSAADRQEGDVLTVDVYGSYRASTSGARRWQNRFDSKSQAGGPENFQESLEGRVALA